MRSNLTYSDLHCKMVMKIFVSNCSDTSIKEWDLSSMSCVRSLHGHKGEVYDFKVNLYCLFNVTAGEYTTKLYFL